MNLTFKKKTTTRDPATVKKKYYAAISMLLIAAILLISASYAWFVLSTHPEVTGISTSIGANGSLEIALFNTDTWKNYDHIVSPVGSSADVNPATISNLTWGNLVDLSDVSYGLDRVTLYPSRLNVTGGSDGSINNDSSHMLAVATYGSDGRVKAVASESVVSSVFDKSSESFLVKSDEQSHGVRAIGIVDGVNTQQLALRNAADTILKSYSSAKDKAKSAVSISVASLGGIALKKATGTNAFTAEDIDAIKEAASYSQDCVNEIENVLRYAVVAKLSSIVTDETDFETKKSDILDKDKSLTYISTTYPNLLPQNFNEYLTIVSGITQKLNDTFTRCNNLLLDEELTYYTDAQIKNAASLMVDTNGIFINDKKLEQCSADDLASLLSGMEISVSDGLFVTIADFVGDYNTTTKISALSASVYVRTARPESHLESLKNEISGYAAAAGVSNDKVITETYAYALDLAFRCNAEKSDLLLQTAASQRVYSDSDSPATLGSGSNMTFDYSVTDSFEDWIDLIAAIRVGFIQDDTVLAVGKLDVTTTKTNDYNQKVVDLYLYETSVGKTVQDNANTIVLGKRLDNKSPITTLDRNVVTPVSVVVWLDGDLVDNTVVSSSVDLNAMLNLQFASSADLVPMGNIGLKNMTVDKEGLKGKLETYGRKSEDGFYPLAQGNYTALSYNEYVRCFNNAKNAVDSVTADKEEINIINTALDNAYNSLTLATRDALEDAFAQMTEIYNGKNSNKLWTDASFSTFQSFYDNKVIYRFEVDGVTPLAPIGERWELVRGEETGDVLVYDSEGPTVKPTGSIELDPHSEYSLIKDTINTGSENESSGSESVDTSRPIFIKTSSGKYVIAEFKKESKIYSKYTAAYTEAEINEVLAIFQSAVDALKPRNHYSAHKLDGKLYYKSAEDGNWYASPNGENILKDKTLYDLKFKDPEDLTLNNYVKYSLADRPEDMNISGNKLSYFVLPATEDDKYTMSVVESDTNEENTHKVVYKQETKQGFKALVLDDALAAIAGSNDSITDYMNITWSSSDTSIASVYQSCRYRTDAENVVLRDYRGDEIIDFGERFLVIGGKPGSTVIKASGYTDNGVKFDVSISLVVYNKANGAKIEQDGSNPTYTVYIIDTEDKHSSNEHISSVTWSIDNKNVASVTDNGQSCTIKNKNEGPNDAIIILTANVKSVEGNSYKATISIEVPHKSLN